MHTSKDLQKKKTQICLPQTPRHDILHRVSASLWSKAEYEVAVAIECMPKVMENNISNQNIWKVI